MSHTHTHTHLNSCACGSFVYVSQPSTAHAQDPETKMRRSLVESMSSMSETDDEGGSRVWPRVPAMALGSKK